MYSSSYWELHELTILTLEQQGMKQSYVAQAQEVSQSTWVG